MHRYADVGPGMIPDEGRLRKVSAPFPEASCTIERTGGNVVVRPELAEETGYFVVQAAWLTVDREGGERVVGVPHQAANLGGDRLTPAPNAEAASWLRSLDPDGAVVASLVPPVFEAYARVFHPAARAQSADATSRSGYPLERYRHV